MSETLTDELLGRLIDGRYEVRERVARGGMATVYVAFDRRLERMVAIKVMQAPFTAPAEHHEFAARFRREAKAAARLTHPGMVRVYDQGVDGDISYLTMEYVQGENLRARLSHEGTLSVGESLTLVESVLDALSAAHRQGLVHRDVKPENILIDTDGYPKLADFGLARAVTEVTATSTGVIMGTVAYLAPELIQNGEGDARSDVYASGILLFEALTGRQPFTGKSAIDIAARHVHEDVPAPSTFVPWLPVEIDALVASLCARDVAQRPADATVALSILRQTRAMIDDPTLDRRAQPPSGTIALGADDRTAVMEHSPAGSTVALPLGLGTGAHALVEPDFLDDDPDAIEPQPDRKKVIVWVGALLTALIALGLIGTWWYNNQGPGAYTTVPPVEGYTAADAESLLRTAGLEPIMLQQNDDEVPAGIVISSTPAGQEQIAKGGEVKVFVSKGPLMKPVPGVIGIPLNDAINELKDATFPIGAQEGVYSDTVPVDEVISTSPMPDEIVPHNTPIDLTYSLGPSPVQMPDLVGYDAVRAQGLLEKSFAMVVTIQYERTLDVNKGEVIRSDPEALSQTTRTAAVTLYVSEGKPLVEMPQFVGLTVAQAEKLAEDNGLVIDWQKANNFFWTEKKYVADQKPNYGTQLEMGDTITLYYDS